ncbi:MAG TPA: hypothetical protein PKC49_04015 [Phycisphaerae bacterium]|nr:hypothetical protein [Phycisphaerae bacterium]
MPPAQPLTWGRDLSGSLDGAGGIGGLLAIQDTNGTPSSDTDDLRYVYFYDANGNVGQVIDLAHDPNDPTAAIKAHYEYDQLGMATPCASLRTWVKLLSGVMTIVSGQPPPAVMAWLLDRRRLARAALREDAL